LSRFAWGLGAFLPFFTRFVKNRPILFSSDGAKSGGFFGFMHCVIVFWAARKIVFFRNKIISCIFVCFLTVRWIFVRVPRLYVFNVIKTGRGDFRPYIPKLSELGFM
jgi:hypothetical protein